MVYINTTGKHNEVWLDKPYATITVECPECPSTEDAYSSGWTDGSEDGYHKGYQSGRTDGHDDGWGPGYESGYTDGLEACSGSSCNLQSSKTVYLGGFEWSYDSGEGGRAPRYMISGSPVHISADTGYDGLEEIQLTGYFHPTEAYDDGYGKGFTSGYTAGREDCSGETINNQPWKTIDLWQLNKDDTSKFELLYSDKLGYYYATKPGVEVEATYDSGYTGLKKAGALFRLIPTEAINIGYESGYTAGQESCSGVTPDLERISIDLTSFFKYWPESQTYSISGSAVPYCVFPDSGYDGLERVCIYTNIDASEAIADGFQSGYTSGYSSGYEQGLADCSGVTTEDGLIANLQGDYFYIPEGTTHLRDYAFYQTCFSSITIPDTVVAIGINAFAVNRCLTSITIPDSVQGLGAQAFYRCTNLQTAILGNGLSQLVNGTFQNCYNLTGITIPSGITAIDTAVFSSCSGLTEMIFEGLTPPTLVSISGASASLGSTAYTFPIYVPCESVEAYKTAFGQYYEPRIMCNSGFTPATSITLNVDSAITGTGQTTVTANPSGAGTDITYTSSDPTVATIDDSGLITVLQDGSVTFCAVDTLTQLQDCKMVNVTADSGSGVYLAGMYYVTSTTEPTQILTRNYGHDILLDKMEYPLGQSRETSNYFTFPATGMQTVYFYFKDPATIPDKTFSGVTQLVGVNIPSVVNKIGDGAFRETSLTEVNVPSGVSLADYAFTRIPTLTAVTLGEGLSFSGGMECFSRTPIVSITFPQSISAAPSHVLYNCSALTNVVFNGTLERLDDAAFGNCTALRNYVIPSSVTFIGENCFVGIPDIGSITLLRTTPAPLDNNTTSLGYITETFPIYVPAGSVEAYKAEYLNYASRIQAKP